MPHGPKFFAERAPSPFELNNHVFCHFLKFECISEMEGRVLADPIYIFFVYFWNRHLHRAVSFLHKTKPRCFSFCTIKSKVLIRIYYHNKNLTYQVFQFLVINAEIQLSWNLFKVKHKFTTWWIIYAKTELI